MTLASYQKASCTQFKIKRNFTDCNQLHQIEKCATTRFASIYTDYHQWKLTSPDEYRQFAEKQMLWVAVSDSHTDSEDGTEVQVQVQEQEEHSNRNRKMRALGFVACDLLLNPENNQYMLHIDKIYVDPLYQRKGIGTELLNQIILYALQNHIRVLTLRTFFTCEWGIGLYEKLGFIECHDNRFQHIQPYILKERQHGMNVDDRCTMYYACLM